MEVWEVGGEKEVKENWESDGAETIERGRGTTTSFLCYRQFSRIPQEL